MIEDFLLDLNNDKIKTPAEDWLFETIKMQETIKMEEEFHTMRAKNYFYAN